MPVLHPHPRLVSHRALATCSLAECCHNELDATKGRQLPMHIGSPEKHCQYVKSNLGQQVPAANGAAYAMKLQGRSRCAITYFGEGCASEGDIPSALNIAAVHGCPTIFFCRNNGYAISTHTDDQYKSDGIAPRGIAYGMPSIRVDGNDILAVYEATKEARRLAVEENKPTMIEGMSYRINSHSTSDDDSKYRRSESPVAGAAADERDYWEQRSPITRFGKYLQNLGWWDMAHEEELRKAERAHAIKALNDAEALPNPHIKVSNSLSLPLPLSLSRLTPTPVRRGCLTQHLFTDVFNEPMPWHLQEQMAELKDHLDKYHEHYKDIPHEQIETMEP